mgnify:CR=1 FL=1
MSVSFNDVSCFVDTLGKKRLPKFEGRRGRSEQEGDRQDMLSQHSSSFPSNHKSDFLTAEQHSLEAIQRGHSVHFAYVTVVTRGEFLRAACALGSSLLQSHTKFARVALLSDEVAGSEKARRLLNIAGFNVLLHVNKIEQPRGAHVKFWWKEDSFTKLNVFQLTQYRKIVMLDADTVVAPGEILDHLFWLGSTFPRLHTILSHVFDNRSNLNVPWRCCVDATYAAVPEIQPVHTGHRCSHSQHDGRTWLSNIWLKLSSCDKCENFGMHRYCVKFRTSYHGSIDFVEFNTGVYVGG